MSLKKDSALQIRILEFDPSSLSLMDFQRYVRV